MSVSSVVPSRIDSPSDTAAAAGAAPGDNPPGQYVVVARRYRPQAFGELIGQEHVGRGLSGAILSQRVGHAYLFTGARGVGKTSTARILAKALNCEQGPTPAPCNSCDICLSISGGDDVDVLEIDGASNRGIDEIRQLRQNVNIRPSRSRYKVYIIDEVHMLTREAFNALLKTLEEPPEHVKFIFCTTEPEKIPITILSRCQRYDFAGIQAPSIAERLKQIAEAEGVQAEPEALAILARRAAGSMRDSQSLLEQLLAFGSKTITVADVHSMLGTAGGERLAKLVEHLVSRDVAGALADLDAALTEGVDVGQLLDQLLGYFRDIMAVAVGCGSDNLLNTSASDEPHLKAAAERLGLPTILAMMQIIDQTLARLRFSTHARTLAELALARIASLEDLESVADAAAEIRSGVIPPAASATAPPRPMMSVSPPAKKKDELSGPLETASSGGNGSYHRGGNGHVTHRESGIGSRESGEAVASPPRSGTLDPAAHAAAPSPPPASSPTPQASSLTPPPAPAAPLDLTPQLARQLWQKALAQVDDLTADHAKMAADLSFLGPSQLAVTFPAKYSFSKASCEKPDKTAKLEEALAAVAGRRIGLKFQLAAEPASPADAARRPVSPRQRKVELERQLRERPIVQKAMQLFGATEIAVVEKPECSKDSAT